MSVGELALHRVTRIKIKREPVRNHAQCGDHDIVRIVLYTRTVSGDVQEAIKLTLYGEPGEPTFEGDLVLK